VVARITKDANGEQLAITIGGHVLPVVVSSEGEFYAEWEASTYHSTTFKGLRAKLLRAKAAEEALAAWLKDRELKPKALVRKKLEQARGR